MALFDLNGFFFLVPNHEQPCRSERNRPVKPSTIFTGPLFFFLCVPLREAPPQQAAFWKKGVHAPGACTGSFFSGAPETGQIFYFQVTKPPVLGRNGSPTSRPRTGKLATPRNFQNIPLHFRFHIAPPKLPLHIFSTHRRSLADFPG